MEVKCEKVMERSEDAVPSATSSWYGKFFEYWWNRNRVGPGKVKLPDCEFLVVGPRRTLRVLRPPLKNAEYYEHEGNNQTTRAESLNDNFFARWSKRPHSSNNCRCSFRRASGLSTLDEQIITDELNRIRTSLCEAERTGHDIQELERRVSVNLQKLHVPGVDDENANHENSKSTSYVQPLPESQETPANDSSMKNKIVKDLERYINTLLEEILDDTVKHVSETEGTSTKERKNTKNKAHLKSLAKEVRHKGQNVSESSADKSSDNESSFGEISFSFHAINGNEANEINERKDGEEGYVNEGFVGSVDDPDSLDFRLTRPERTFEQVDCIDSGINSVETIEFQPDQEPSLEESLIRIIDEKLGRTPLKRSNEDVNACDNYPSGRNEDAESRERTKFVDTVGDGLVVEEKSPKVEDTRRELVKLNNPPVRKVEDISRSESCGRDEVEDSHLECGNHAGGDIASHNLRETALDIRESEETVKESSFEKLRLEFTEDTEGAKGPAAKTKRNAMAKLREKLSGSFDKTEKDPSSRSVLALPLCGKKDIQKDDLVPRKEVKSIELEDYRKKWPEVDGRLTVDQSNPRNSVIRRRNRKPTIIFLHGFGSSAEIFSHQLEYFSALGYPCIAPDMLGHGMSSAPARKRDYHFSKLFKDLDAVLQHYALEPGQKCVIVAHNYGCSFAIALANKYECNIHQLVLISGGGPIPLGAPSTEGAGQCCLRAILAPFLLCGLHRDLLYTPIGRQHPYCGPEPTEQWPSHMKYILDGMIWPEGDSVFHKRIRTPTLLVHGLRDNKVSLVQECQMERAMAKAFLEAIPAAGHDPMTDCPDQLNHMVHCFIDLWKNRK